MEKIVEFIYIFIPIFLIIIMIYIMYKEKMMALIHILLKGKRK